MRTLPSAVLAVRPRGDGWDDGDERGRFGRELAEAEGGEGGDEEDAAADAEEPREDACCDAGREEPRSCGCRPLEPAGGLGAIAEHHPEPDRDEQRREREGEVAGRDPLLQRGSERGRRRRLECRRGRPARSRPLPRSRRASLPVAVITIAASEVPVASRAGKPASIISSGTATMPPPTPNSELNRPATRPMATITTMDRRNERVFWTSDTYSCAIN